jgi:hypothetical protein
METIDIGGKEALQILVESELGKEKGGGVIGMNLTYVFFEHDNRIIAVRYDASNELFEKITESISFEPYLNIK